jgi:polyphosphate kinase 2 (PPK2 family)
VIPSPGRAAVAPAAKKNAKRREGETVFEIAELGQKVTKEEFDRIAPALRIEMLEVQQALRNASFPVIVVFAGVDGAGKGESVNLLNEWMDPRWIVTRAYGEPSEEERERPEYWRYWRDLPPKGKFGLFLSAWYSRPILDRVYGRIDDSAFNAKLDRIVDFERWLANDGALIVKFWMHLGKQVQKKRLKSLEKDPLQSWRVTETDWRHWRMYGKFVAAAERTITRTSTGLAPWTIVEGADPRFRALTVLTHLRDAVRGHLAKRAAEEKVLAEIRAQHMAARAVPSKAKPAKAKPAKSKGTRNKAAAGAPLPDPATVGHATVLDRLDMTQSATPEQYGLKTKELRAKLARLFRDAKARQISSILVFEGWDAAGKGGAIRRLTAALDARDCLVLPFAAPTDEERAQHYLWRFWRHLSRAGRLTIFDRSWYGRVLVERVEGFATETEWRRAYAEINAFEEQLAEHGIVLLKFWLHITADEQLRRFLDREKTLYKQWKLTEEDWRNREKWPLYEQAVNEMVEHTSTALAPWTLVEANDKRYARLKIIETYCDRLEAVLGRKKGLKPGKKDKAGKTKAKG